MWRCVLRGGRGTVGQAALERRAKELPTVYLRHVRAVDTVKDADVKAGRSFEAVPDKRTGPPDQSSKVVLLLPRASRQRGYAIVQGLGGG